MEILVLGGTRFFGVHMVNELLKNGHQVTIATRGRAEDNFGDSVKRIKIERTNPKCLLNAFKDKYYDVVCDDLAFCSNEVKSILDSVKCGRYVMVSTAAVYDLHLDTLEDDFDPLSTELIWCSRYDFPYDEIKRQAECALFQKYPSQNAVAVRFPFATGEDDYTKRLYFYVEHIVKGIPMFVDNKDKQLGFVRSDEAGKFLAFLAEHEFCGAINGGSYGTISIDEIAAYVESKTGAKAKYSQDGEMGPYNMLDDFSINTERAKSLGFTFSNLNDWIYDLLDQCIKVANDSLT